MLAGTTIKCIDELLNAWEWSRQRKKELHTLFYDIKQAYDSVQASVLVRALRRIGLPINFVRLIADSLDGLTSCVRTIYGDSRIFEVHRSLRQGDPLAPLLFVILMDGLHDGLHTNPFTGRQHGCRLRACGQPLDISSLGFADDTAVLTNNLADLKVQNEWVHYFMWANLMRLNGLKSELVGRMADGTPLLAAASRAAGIVVDGANLTPVSHDHPVRYLGAHFCFDGSWSAMQRRGRETVMLFARLVSKFSLSIRQAVFLFNIYLLPRLNLALHYTHGPHTAKWVRSLDSIVIGAIKHAAATPLRLSHSAVALTLHLMLPSWLETSVKVCELFLRMNSADERWGHLGRMLMQTQCASEVSGVTPLPRQDRGTLITRSAFLATRKLQWSLHLDQHRRAGGRAVHLLSRAVLELAPLMAAGQCSSSSTVTLSCSDRPVTLAHDAWSGWGTRVPALPQPIHVYTDGSHESAADASSWAVVVADRCFDDNFASVPADELQVCAADVAGCTLFGSSISCTRGVYPAELQAIARTLAMFPVTVSLHLHSDSQASLAAITAYQHSVNEREQMRMTARPLLSLIHRLIQVRTSAGAVTLLSHVRAHTRNMDAHSVGNRLADYQANLSRTQPVRCQQPRSLLPLPLESCERHLLIRARDGTQVIDDIRRTSTAQQRAASLERWWTYGHQAGYFACQGMLDLGAAVMSATAKPCSTPLQQATLVHVGTNSIQFHWVEDESTGVSSLRQIQCRQCGCSATLTHLANCVARPGVAYRARLQSATIRLLTGVPATRAFARRHSGTPLPALLDAIVPLRGRAFAPPPDVQHHLARSMVGAFTTAEASAAVRNLKFAPAEEGHQTLQQTETAVPRPSPCLVRCPQGGARLRQLSSFSLFSF